MSADVTIVDYGIGNLLSVQRALEHSGRRVSISSDPTELLAAARLVLPGVGAFPDGMAGLRRLGLIPVVKQFAASGRPLLGICLGMQMLGTLSEEFGEHEGLDLIPGRVVHIPSTTSSGEHHRIPHIGWAALSRGPGAPDWRGTPFEDVKDGDSVYLVHSFMLDPTNEAHRFAECYYNGRRITAAVRNANVIGTQFHPEKSGRIGLEILARFARMS